MKSSSSSSFLGGGGNATASYPSAACVSFTPGGLNYKQPKWVHLNDYSHVEPRSTTSSGGGGGGSTPLSAASPAGFGRRSSSGGGPSEGAAVPSTPSSASLSSSSQYTPDSLVQEACWADGVLRQYACWYAESSAAAAAGSAGPAAVPHFLPSLSALSSAAFHPLTGVPPTSVKRWADVMVLTYHQQSERDKNSAPPTSEESIWDRKPTGGPGSSSDPGIVTESAAMMLRNLWAAQKQQADSSSSNKYVRRRPCGYVFVRGDIAWNCRTCQTDPTCVICDPCFRKSDHEGHEVYFHRTTPGGCCDCGDAEAWSVAGCCPDHRPMEKNNAKKTCIVVPDGNGDAAMTDDDIEENGEPDEGEAVGMAQEGHVEGMEMVSEFLPPRLAAALGVVIGAAVHSLVETCHGAALGADPYQWKYQWIDEACKVWNGTPAHAEEYYAVAAANAAKEQLAPSQRQSCPPTTFAIPESVLREQSFPPGYRLHLRLHNDDVHTFDEVIEALHDTSSRHLRTAAALRANNINNNAGGPGNPGNNPNNGGLNNAAALTAAVAAANAARGGPTTGGANNANNDDGAGGNNTGGPNASATPPTPLVLPPLVTRQEDANEMTHRVDADGQVNVRDYTSTAMAMQGYRRLKEKGLHCAVVSTAILDAELRSRWLTSWLADLCSAHPAVAVLVVQALVAVSKDDSEATTSHYTAVGGNGKVLPPVWRETRMIPTWCSLVPGEDEMTSCRRRFYAFPPHLASSYLTRDESEALWRLGMAHCPQPFCDWTGTDPSFYHDSIIPYRGPNSKWRKSPHALWGTVPSVYADTIPLEHKHPLLYRLLVTAAAAGGQQQQPPLDEMTVTMMRTRLIEEVYVIDTDLRKQEESERILSSVYSHRLPGVHLVNKVGSSFYYSSLAASAAATGEIPPSSSTRYSASSTSTSSSSSSPGLSPLVPPPNPMEFRHLLAMSSFRAPASPILMLLLLDPYPTKIIRTTLHALFLSLLVDARFKCRFAAALGAVAYRPLSTLFCAGVGTEADTPLGFTVQIFTAGSLVRALGNVSATEKLLRSDLSQLLQQQQQDAANNNSDIVGPSIGIFAMPIAHSVVRCIHTNLLGATKEVRMLLKNTVTVNDDGSNDEDADIGVQRNNTQLLSLTYNAGEHPMSVPLPAAPDDGFLDSRSTRHKRLPHLLRDLEYLVETPSTALRLLLPNVYPSIQPTSLSGGGMGAASPLLESNILVFASVYARMLRMGQGMDPQKRKISGGHVEYEQSRWLDAFSLSLNFAGTRDALSESLTNSTSVSNSSDDGSHVLRVREAIGNLLVALLRELKFWLYREGALETGLPIGGSQDQSQVEALQRSTLHVSSSQLGAMVAAASSTHLGSTSESPPSHQFLSHHPPSSPSSLNSVALACATGIKMTETQLELIEGALRLEEVQRHSGEKEGSSSGPAMGDWLRIPHSPLGGDLLSFHLPLHRALAKCVRGMCYVVIPQSVRDANTNGWWKLPVLDGSPSDGLVTGTKSEHPIVALARTSLRSSNCRVVWSAGLDCTPPEAQKRRSRAKNVSANIAAAKLVHSLADHPIRCLAAAQQIERHLWTRNGSSTAGMALNYSSAPLCRSFRDLDLTLVQLSAAGMSAGLGARRVFSLMINRFSMDGYLCDPERKLQTNAPSPTGASGNASKWVNPPRLHDPDHAVALSESFFSTMCILVTELPAPPALSSTDNSAIRSGLRRELLHALAAEPRSHSEAIEAATAAGSRRDESAGISGSGGSGAGTLGDVFTSVLREVGKQKNQANTRSASGPSAYELRAECSDEYDPTFFHLRRQEHQHAMDTISRLRRQKAGKEKADSVCYPIVCPPPKAHPRFLACRLLLHLNTMDAAIRRALLFAVTGGLWLPPIEPVVPEKSELEEMESSSLMVSDGTSVPVHAFGRRHLYRATSSGSRRGSDIDAAPFSAATVAASSISYLEVLQLLTLQVHTLEECASLHRLQPDIDEEAKTLSRGLSIESYLRRLIHVPESLEDAWAFRPFPGGPLPSSGSGECRASILGFLITLYEHRTSPGDKDERAGDAADEGHGGSRTLSDSGLKWLLRFVQALVDGASSVGAAVKCATTGVPVRGGVKAESWTIDSTISSGIKNMLRDLPDLWPTKADKEQNDEADRLTLKNKEARKAAQQRVMEMMKRKQAKFAETIDSGEGAKMDVDDDDEQDLCIICRCDDTDGENNGPLGYLGHVQRSRYTHIRAANEMAENDKLFSTYRVSGHRGCQLRKTEAMDSEALVCLPTGSIVTIMSSTVTESYGILRRRVFVRHVERERGTRKEIVTEGWASVQSSEGYVILSPLSVLCSSNTRWGSTRPVIRQCGHAAHLKCVETHILSLHQRDVGEQPYDGRFAANIKDGEFLCPLCKQLSNLLLPRDGCAWSDVCTLAPKEDVAGDDMEQLRNKLAEIPELEEAPDDGDGVKALSGFGDQLQKAMGVPWERPTNARKKKMKRWPRFLQQWDFEEKDTGIKDTLTKLRQLHIAWASVGHSAATTEASSRGVEEVLPFGVFAQTTDPWTDFGEKNRDTHPMLLELRRGMTAAAGLYDIFVRKALSRSDETNREIVSDGQVSMIGLCISDIIEGHSLFSQRISEKDARWFQFAALLAATPSHVALDGMLSVRHDARAVAAQMWLIRCSESGKKGTMDDGGDVNDESNLHPPTPLAVKAIQAKLGEGHQSTQGFGSLDVVAEPSDQPFLPGLACGFLYAPLLSWDLSSLAGANFSLLLANAKGASRNLPKHLLVSAKLLFVGRLIQSIISPRGFALLEDDEDFDQFEHWKMPEFQRESSALIRLIEFCRSSLGFPVTELKEEDSMKVFSAVGRSILPFGRTLILILRAAASALRLREKKARAAEEVDTSFQPLQQVLEGDLMSVVDGLALLKKLVGIVPSNILPDEKSSDRLLISCIKRWLEAVDTLEKFHGSRGKSPLDKKLSPSKASAGKNETSVAKKMRMEESVEVSEFGSNVNTMVDANDEHSNTVTLRGLLMGDDDQDMIEAMDVAAEEEEEAVGVASTGGTADAIAEPRHANEAADDTSDEEDDDEGDVVGGGGDALQVKFAFISRSAIIPYQPSFLARSTIGPGARGSALEFDTASAVMRDLSHLGAIHRQLQPTKCLINLPKSFVELYSIVNQVKGGRYSHGNDDGGTGGAGASAGGGAAGSAGGDHADDDPGSSETAICLLTGAVMRSGSSRRSTGYSRSARLPGTCTLYARQTGSGIGIFFLVQKCTTLLMHNNKSAYSASLYVDQHGEEDPGLKRGRPLFLNEARVRALEQLWRQQGIPREVAQIRSTSDRVIRDDWY